MRAKSGNSSLELVLGDITAQQVDVIVNAANSALAGGGGVDGAIHRAAGPAVMQETKEKYPDGCPAGSAVITGGGNLSARFVIHAVGPVWAGGKRNEAELLASCYQSSLDLAAQYKLASIAFPAISCGAYAFPIELASRIAIRTVKKWTEENDLPELIRFTLFDDAALQAFKASVEQHLSSY